MRPVHVHGVGLWSPGFADAAAWCQGEPDPGVQAPTAAWLSGTLRRRASALTRMAIEALDQAVTRAGVSPATLRSVWATAHGEHATAIAILEMMHRGEGKLSPTRFHNSVYNTASGYASIAAGNRSASTTLTGGSELVAMSLLEAACWLEDGAEEVGVVLADEPLLGPFAVPGTATPLAVAFCLSTRAAGALATLSSLRRERIAGVKPLDRFGRLYVSAALPLLERVALGRPGLVALELDEGSGEPLWCADVELVGAAFPER